MSSTDPFAFMEGQPEAPAAQPAAPQFTQEQLTFLDQQFRARTAEQEQVFHRRQSHPRPRQPALK